MRLQLHAIPSGRLKPGLITYSHCHLIEAINIYELGKDRPEENGHLWLNYPQILTVLPSLRLE